MAREHALYRAYTSAGQLIYVGISSNPQRRLLREHRAYSAWYAAAEYAEVRIFPDAETALIAEANAIRREKPYHAPLYDTSLLSDDYVEPEPIRLYRIQLSEGGVFD